MRQARAPARPSGGPPPSCCRASGSPTSADRYPRELPFGLQKRADLARADRARRAGLLLLDEPFGGLDATEREHPRRADPRPQGGRRHGRDRRPRPRRPLRRRRSGRRVRLRARRSPRATPDRDHAGRARALAPTSARAGRRAPRPARRRQRRARWSACATSPTTTTACTRCAGWTSRSRPERSSASSARTARARARSGGSRQGCSSRRRAIVEFHGAPAAQPRPRGPRDLQDAVGPREPRGRRLRRRPQGRRARSRASTSCVSGCRSGSGIA